MPGNHDHAGREMHRQGGQTIMTKTEYVRWLEIMISETEQSLQKLDESYTRGYLKALQRAIEKAKELPE